MFTKSKDKSKQVCTDDTEHNISQERLNHCSNTLTNTLEEECGWCTESHENIIQSHGSKESHHGIRQMSTALTIRKQHHNLRCKDKYKHTSYNSNCKGQFHTVTMSKPDVLQLTGTKVSTNNTYQCS